MSVSFNGGSIAGLHIGGGGGNTANWETTTVKGRSGRDIQIQYEPGNPAVRNVQIGQGMFTSVAPGVSTRMNINGLDISSDNGTLWVDGQKVDFSGGKTAAVVPSAAQQSAAQQLEARFPGVSFTNPDFITVGPDVKIAAGASIEGMPPGTVIDGASEVGPRATVSGCSVQDSVVLGSVRGGNVVSSRVEEQASVLGGDVRDSTIGAGARVSGGNLRDSHLAASAIVSGGNLRDTHVESGAIVSGGNLRDMKIDSGSIVSGGNLRDFTLGPGQVVSGGTHNGKLSDAGEAAGGITIRSGSFSGDTNVVLGNVSQGISIVGAVVSGSVVIGDVHSSIRVNSVGAGQTVVGLTIGDL